MVLEVGNPWVTVTVGGRRTDSGPGCQITDIRTASCNVLVPSAGASWDVDWVSAAVVRQWVSQGRAEYHARRYECPGQPAEIKRRVP